MIVLLLTTLDRMPHHCSLKRKCVYLTLFVEKSMLYYQKAIIMGNSSLCCMLIIVINMADTAGKPCRTLQTYIHLEQEVRGKDVQQII